MRGLVRLFELDGVFGIAALAARRKVDELALTSAYTKLGEALGLDWAQQQVARFVPSNQWERLLTAGLARDFEQLRIDFLARRRIEPARCRASSNGSPAKGRGSRSSASCSPARGPRAMSARRCSRRSPTRRGSCWRADGVRVAFLVPDPDYPAEWRWAYDAEAAALIEAGVAVEPMPGPTRGLVAGSTSSCRWSRGAITRVTPIGSPCSTGSSASGLPVVNPPAAAMEQRQGLSRGAWREGHCDRPDAGGRGLMTSRPRGGAGAFRCSELVVKPPVSASAYGTFRLGPATPSPKPCGLADDGPAVGRRRSRPGRIFADPVRRRVEPCAEQGPQERRIPRPAEYGGIIQRCDPPTARRSWRGPRLPPRPAPSTYARVDIVVGDGGELLVMELELIEPALFLDHAPEAARRSPARSCQPPSARANSHWRIAEVRFGGDSTSSRAASISATNALTGRPLSARRLPALARKSARG